MEKRYSSTAENNNDDVKIEFRYLVKKTSFFNPVSNNTDTPNFKRFIKIPYKGYNLFPHIIGGPEDLVSHKYC